MIRTVNAMLFLVAACGLVTSAARCQPTTTATSKAAPANKAGALELVILSDEKMSRVTLSVEVDGRSLPAIWDETFGKLFAYYDRDGDGSLNDKEALRLPSSFSLRQLVWGQSVPYAGPAVAWKQLDRDGDGKVTKAELIGFYHQKGFDQILVGVGKPRATEPLTAALVKALDTDGNGIVSEAEWKAAPDSLKKFDRNDDELIGPGELVPKIAYPGTVGGILTAAPTANDPFIPELEGLPVVILPTDHSDTYWATTIIARCDKDKDGKLNSKEAGLSVDVFATLDKDSDRKLSPVELAAWREMEPVSRFTIRLGKRDTKQPSLEVSGNTLSTGRLRLEVRQDEGKMPELVATARKRLLDRFTDADADADDFVVEAEMTKRNHAELKQLLVVGDVNADGKLSRQELVAWLDLQDQVAAGHVLLTVLDHGAGLFELLDVDHDGSLSIPELRGVWDRVKTNDCVAADGNLDPAKLPRQLIFTASRGHPLNPLGSARRDGPVWFKAMDRNGDGFVSQREFTAAPEVFEKLDLDEDGFISSEEAKASKAK